MGKSKLWLCGAVAAAAIAAGTRAEAALIIDVRTDTGGKTATVSVVSDVVNIRVYGIVTGAGATSNEGLQSAYGSLVSGNGGLLGTIGAASSSGNFGGTFQAGAAFDADTDTDTDRGAANGGTVADYIYFRAASIQTGGTAVTWNGAAGNEYLLGTATFTVTALNIAGTTINWIPRLSVAGNSVTTAALWQEDGIGTANPGNLTYDETTSSYRAGSDLVVTVPEPSSIIAFGGLAGLVVFRRERRA